MRHPGLQPLWDGLQSEWRQQQLVALGMLVTGVGLVVWTMTRQDAWLGLVGGLAATAAIYWLIRLSGRKPVSELYHLLREEPERIEWVYAEVTERNPFGFRFSRMAVVYLVEGDGEEHSVQIRADKAKLVSKTLNRVLPHATFGYSEERELKYRGEVRQRNRYWREF